MTEHPDLETLSATLDGEPESSHLRGCDTCQARLARLRVARDSVASAVPPPPAEQQEQAIARALAAAPAGDAAAAHEPAGDAAAAHEPAGPPDGTAPVPADPPSRGTPAPVVTLSRRRWWLGGSVAAAVLAIAVGSVALVGGQGGPRTGGPAALSSDAATEGAGVSVGGDQVLDAGDLGDFPSIEAVRNRVTAGTVTAAPAGVPSPAVGGPALNAASPSPEAAPRQIGTRVCEIEARIARPQLGVLVYAGTLRFQNTPAVVLGFGPTPQVAPEALLVLAPQEGCRILAESPG